MNISNYFQLLIKELSFQALEKIFRSLFGLYLLNKLSSYLGTENFGNLNFYEIYVQTIFGLSIFGLDVLLIKKFKNNEDYFLNGIIALSGVSLLFIGITISVILFTSNSFELILLTLCLFFNPFLVVEYKLYAENKIRVTSIFRFFAYLTKCFLFLFFIENNKDLIFFVYAILGEQLLYCILLYIYFNKNKHIAQWYKLNWDNFNWYKISKLYKKGILLFFNTLGGLIHSRIDIFLVSIYLSSHDLSIYSAPLRVITFLYFIPIIISNTLFPKIIEISLNSGSDENTLAKIYRFNFYLSIVIFLILFSLSQHIIITIYGDDFFDSIQIFKFLSLNLIFITLNSIFVKVLYSKDLEKKLMLRSFFGIIINLSLTSLLIKEIGILGVVASTLFSFFFIEIIYDFFDPKLRQLHIFKLKSLIFI